MRNNSSDNRKIRPWEEGAGEVGVSFGSWLRQQRTIRGIKLRDISESSKISMRYLEALESSRFGILPAPVFAKGFLRQYAVYVGLDPDEVVNYYILAQEDAPPEDELHSAGSRLHSSTQWAYGLVLTLGVVILFGVVALLSFFAERRGLAEEAPPPMAAPLSSPQAARPEIVADVPSAPLVVILDFLQDSWVEALVDGGERLSELRVQGESLQLEAQRSVTLTLGNPSGVRVEVNGAEFPIESGDDGELSDLLISLDAVSAAAASRGGAGIGEAGEEPAAVE